MRDIGEGGMTSVGCSFSVGSCLCSRRLCLFPLGIGCHHAVLNFSSSCLSRPSAGIASDGHHAGSCYSF